MEVAVGLYILNGKPFRYGRTRLSSDTLFKVIKVHDNGDLDFEDEFKNIYRNMNISYRTIKPEHHIGFLTTEYITESNIHMRSIIKDTIKETIGVS